SSQEAISRLEKAGIANARLNSMEEFWNHPQLKARDRWREVATPAGPIQALKPPFNLDGFEPRMDEITAVGQHTRKVLQEIGYAGPEIERLASAGAVSVSGPRCRRPWRGPCGCARRAPPRPWPESARRSPRPGT